PHERRANLETFDLNGGLAPPDIELHAAKRRDLLEFRRRLTPSHEIGWNNGIHGPTQGLARLVDLHEAICVAIRKRPQQNLAREAEDGGVDAETEGERRHGDEWDNRTRRQGSERFGKFHGRT